MNKAIQEQTLEELKDIVELSAESLRMGIRTRLQDVRDHPEKEPEIPKESKICFESSQRLAQGLSMVASAYALMFDLDVEEVVDIAVQEARKAVKRGEDDVQ